MLLVALRVCAGVFAASAYGVGLYLWIYRGRVWPALAAILGFYPLIIILTLGTPGLFLRAIPLVGVGMFLHRYRFAALQQIRLLWFTTLSVAVVNVYYLLRGVY